MGDVVMLVDLNEMLDNLWLQKETEGEPARARKQFKCDHMVDFKLVVAGHATTSHGACFWGSHACEFSFLISL